MFATEDDYAKAVKNSSIHIHSESVEVKSKSKGLVYISILTIIGYFGFNYYNSTLKSTIPEIKILAQNSVTHPTAVMGVTHINTITNMDISDIEDEYITALNNMEVDVLTHEVENKNVKLTNEISKIVNNDKIVTKSEYTKKLTKELSSKELERVIIVEEGDTLASLSVKYYGDARKYYKIITSNTNLHDNGDTIYVGQKINLPY